MSAAHVLDALVRLEGMAVAGLPPDDVAHEAELIAAGWWWVLLGIVLGPLKLQAVQLGATPIGAKTPR